MDIYKYVVTEKILKFFSKAMKEPKTLRQQQISRHFKYVRLFQTLTHLDYSIPSLWEEPRSYKVVLVLQNWLSTSHSCVKYLWAHCQLLSMGLINLKQPTMLGKQAKSWYSLGWHSLHILWSNEVVYVSLLSNGISSIQITFSVFISSKS